MGNQLNSTNPNSLEIQVDRLSILAEETYRLLQKYENSISFQVLDNFSQLSNCITELSRQVAQRDKESDNLLALVDIGQIINSSLDLHDVLRKVMDIIVRLINAERGFLMLRDEQGKLVTQVARNWEQESIDSSEFAFSRTVVDRVIAQGIPVLTTNAQEDPRFGNQQSIIAYNLRSILCVPLKVKDELTGVLYADNRIRTGIFGERERDVLAAFANQAAVALENARLFESVRRTLAEVTELKNLMDNVFSSIASGVITSDQKNKIVLCNRAAEAILGHSRSKMVGNSLSEVMPTFASYLTKHIDSVLQTNQDIKGVEFNSTLPKRGPVILSINLSPLKDASQKTQGIAIVLDDLTEKKRLEAQRRLFERMVSPAVIEQLDPDKLQLGGKRAEITVLFADIRGFTSLSERLSPEQLVTVLNRYLSTAADAVLTQEGTIDKFLGDAIMAWFNAPIPQPDHTLRAVRAALDMQTTINSLQSELPPEHHLLFGTGIHFGEAILGLVGNEKRLDYTAIGDSVNTAKRLQENASAGQILISAEAFSRVSEMVIVKQVSPVIAKGKSQPLQVYEVVGLKQ